MSTLRFTLDPGAQSALFLQIAERIASDIQRGRLKPGERLPGTRTLATSLGVHRNTVVAAYRELFAQGWIDTRARSGTMVSRDPPRRTGWERPNVSPRLGFSLPPIERGRPALPAVEFDLASAGPDLTLLPSKALGRALRRAATRRNLRYGDERGFEGLRTAIARLLRARRAIAVDGDEIIITQGSQMSLFLTAHCIVRRGERVAVERFGYRPAWDAFLSAGATLVPIEVDRDGIDVASLRSLHHQQAIRAVYLTPHHQYPTTVNLSPGRRRDLIRFAAEHRVALIEDDYDHEFHYEGRPRLPLKSDDEAGVVVYCGTLSKVIAPGLRIGYLTAPSSLLERIVGLRYIVDRQGSTLVEAAVAELIEEGEIERHARRMRRVYLTRRDALACALRDELGSRTEFDLPPGGMAFWLRVDPCLDAALWAQEALAHGVLVGSGSDFDFHRRTDGPANALRVAFAGNSLSNLAKATSLLRQAAEQLPSGNFGA